AVCTLKDTEVNIRVIDSDDGLPDIIIRKICAIENDLIGIATEDQGLVSVDPSTNEIKRVIPGDWEYGAVNDFVVKEHQIWIASPRNGLLVFDRHLGRIKTYRKVQGE